MKAAHFLSLFIDICVLRHIKILNTPTIFTDQMIMRADPYFISVVGTAKGQFLNQLLFYENIQIPIDSPHA